MRYLECVINSGLLDGIKKTDYIAAFEQLKISTKRYDKNVPIFLAGDIIDRICIIDKGSVRGEKTYANGEVHIVEIYEERSMFGLEIALSKKREAAIDYVSNEETTLVFVSMKSIQNSDYSKELNRILTYKLSNNNVKMTHKIEILAQRSLRGRIMVYLSILSRKANDQTVTIKMNREQLAQYLCVNRSALSNELHKMKKEGIIDFRGQKFTIKE